MGKSSGGTRGSSASSPRGMNRSISGWKKGIDNLGGYPTITASGEEARKLYSYLSSPVERAVETRVGYIRGGGGFTSDPNNREYTLIFRNGTSDSQIKDYLRMMKEGGKLYSAFNDINLSDAEHERAERAWIRWYDRTLVRRS